MFFYDGDVSISNDLVNIDKPYDRTIIILGNRISSNRTHSCRCVPYLLGNYLITLQLLTSNTIAPKKLIKVPLGWYVCYLCVADRSDIIFVMDLQSGKIANSFIPICTTLIALGASSRHYR